MIRYGLLKYNTSGVKHDIPTVWHDMIQYNTAQYRDLQDHEVFRNNTV